MPLLLTISGFSLVLIGTVVFAAERLGQMRLKVRFALPHAARGRSSLSLTHEPVAPVVEASAQMSLFDQVPDMVPDSSPLIPVLPVSISEPIEMRASLGTPVSPEAPEAPEQVVAVEMAAQPPVPGPQLAPDPRRRARAHTAERLDWAYFNKDSGDLEDPGPARILPVATPRLQLRQPPRSA